MAPRSKGQGNNLKIGVTAEAIAVDSSGSVTIWTGGESVPTETGDTVTAYLDWMDGGEAISSGKQVLLAKFGTIWRIIGAECEGNSDPSEAIGYSNDTTKPNAATTSYNLYANQDGLWNNNSGTWEIIGEANP